MQTSERYLELINNLSNQVNIDRIADLYGKNLAALKDATVTIGNIIGEFINNGEFVKVEGDANYPGDTVDFYIDTKFGHSIYIALYTDRPHYISISTGKDEYAITAHNKNINIIIQLLRSYNHLRVVDNKNNIYYTLESTKVTDAIG